MSAVEQIEAPRGTPPRDTLLDEEAFIESQLTESPAKTRAKIVLHVAGLGGGGDGRRHRGVADDEFQEDLGPGGAVDLAGPGRQRFAFRAT